MVLLYKPAAQRMADCILGLALSLALHGRCENLGTGAHRAEGTAVVLGWTTASWITSEKANACWQVAYDVACNLS